MIQKDDFKPPQEDRKESKAFHQQEERPANADEGEGVLEGPTGKEEQRHHRRFLQGSREDASARRAARQKERVRSSPTRLAAFIRADS